MVGPLEQAILALMIFVIMLGMGASLTPRDFILALKRPYGLFIGEMVNFLVVAFALYLFIVKFLGWVMKTRKQEAAAAPPPAPSKQEQLLAEIRDLLKTQKS